MFTAIGLTSAARAGTQDWQVSEVLISAAGDPRVRYIEMENPVGGCLFPQSRVEVYDGAGNVLGVAAPVVQTVCYGANTFFLLATAEAAAGYGVTEDYSIVPAMPPDAGQVCFVSSGTRYDCVRWGDVTVPLPDFYAAGDRSAVAAPPDGYALARVDVTHEVAVDWIVAGPTPRRFNDGTPWDPPDAGPVPDAGSVPDGGVVVDGGAPVDAGPVDARPDARSWPDARQRPDARDTRYLDLDPAGGAACGCRVGGHAPGSRGSVLVLVLALVVLFRARRPSQAGPTSASGRR